MNDNKVLVIGGGIGGLCTAIGLSQNGVPAEVFERMPEVKEIGTGTGIQRVAQEGLRMLGLSDAVEAIGGTPFQAQLLVSRRGRTMATIPRRGEAFVVHRGELMEVFKRELGDASIVHTNRECVGYEQDGTGVTARFADGQEERGIALIAADGVRSVVRQQMIGDGPPRYSGQTAWRGMFKYTHPTLPNDVSEQVWGPAALFGLFPAKDRLFWWASAVRPEGEGDPPGGRKRDLLDTYEGFPESIPDVIQATPDEQIFRGDLYHRFPAKSWTQGRVTLLGDAAHPTMPAFGQGAGMAIEDAAVLARELSPVAESNNGQAITAALTSYEEKRIPRTAAIVNRARRMARLCAWKNPPAMVVREAFISAVPQGVWLRTYEHEHAFEL
jgi:2-polyprenyl-6-methoxyphenol hydroxylase-like FAD-dependent oxidoreductase